MTTCSKCGRQGSRGFRVNRLGATVCTQGGVCARRRSPAATPHLDEADYTARLEAQGGGCALCGAKPKTRRLDVDHDHATGAVRGLLCHRCNRALPTWVDVEWLEAACGYLGGPFRGHHGPHRSLANVVSEGFLLQEQPECAHTPKPRMGYIEHAEWAAKMLKTHRQERCPVCGLWAIWTPKETKAHV